jgi:tyrosine-protein kinase Etk/Wzc
MSKLQNTVPGPELAVSESDTSVLELLIVVVKHKKMVIIATLSAAILALVVSFLLPETFRADAKLLLPQQSQSGAAALLAQLGGAGGAVAGAAGLKNPNDMYVGMFKSRTIADKIIVKFDLKKRYDTDSLDKARLKLAERTFITTAKDGLIRVEVEDEDRKMVAPLVNGYVEEFLKLTNVLAVTEAGQRRMFYERQLEAAKDNLAQSEMSLKGALETRGVISVDSDSRAIVETVSRLRAQISVKEVQINAMRAFVTTSNPEFKRANEEIMSMRAELFKLENGRADATADAPAAGKQVGLENIKILRDVKYHQMLYELLAKQYELSRLDEAKDSAVVQILDAPVEPERKFKPKRAIIILVATMLALVASIAAAFVIESRQQSMRDPAGRERWMRLRDYLRFR